LLLLNAKDIAVMDIGPNPGIASFVIGHVIASQTNITALCDDLVTHNHNETTTAAVCWCNTPIFQSNSR
jgi:hypothetical protein